MAIHTVTASRGTTEHTCVGCGAPVTIAGWTDQPILCQDCLTGARVLDNVKLHEVSINTSGNIDPHAGQVWVDGELVDGVEAAPGFVADDGGDSDTVQQQP